MILALTLLAVVISSDLRWKEQSLRVRTSADTLDNISLSTQVRAYFLLLMRVRNYKSSTSRAAEGSELQIADDFSKYNLLSSHVSCKGWWKFFDRFGNPNTATQIENLCATTLSNPLFPNYLLCSTPSSMTAITMGCIANRLCL